MRLNGLHRRLWVYLHEMKIFVGNFDLPITLILTQE